MLGLDFLGDLGSTAGEAVSSMGANLSGEIPTQGWGFLSSTGPAGGGGGGTNWGQVLKDYAGPVSSALGGIASVAQIPLGLMSLNIAKQGQKALQQGVQTEQQMAAPAIAAENQLFPAGTAGLMTGQLPPELQQQVDNQVNQAKQSMLQQLTSAGISPETAEAMIAGQVEQLRNQLTMNSASSLLQGGQSSANVAGQGGLYGGNLGTTEFNTATGAVTGANNSLMRLLAAQG